MPYEVGTRCWYPSKDQGWIGAEVTKHTLQGDSYNLELTLEDGQKVELLVSSLDETKEPSLPLLRNPPILETTEDLTSLSYLNEPAVLHAIKARYAQLNIYTYSGIVLIATNPFDRVDQLYSQEMIQAYAGKLRGELEPHLFAIAEEAYRLMKTTDQNQTIIVSGESGAGKTVSAKYIMRYFASVEENNEENAHHNLEMSETEKKILATNPIMEAFGNAKTIRNDNSSRFGKYLEILFDDETSIIGARVRTYLLERSRLVFQPKTERNYHIFYQILSGLSDDEKSQLKLTDIQDYHYMNQGGDSHIEGVDDASEYGDTVEALSLVGISKDTQFQLFKILAALLHIGNIEVKKVRNDASLSSDEPNLQIAADLLGIDAFDFAKWVTKKQIVTRSEKIVSSLPYHQAIVSRDSVAKFIYSALFDWLVDNINTDVYKRQVVFNVKESTVDSILFTTFWPPKYVYFNTFIEKSHTLVLVIEYWLFIILRVQFYVVGILINHFYFITRYLPQTIIFRFNEYRWIFAFTTISIRFKRFNGSYQYICTFKGNEQWDTLTGIRDRLDRIQ